MKKLIVTLLHLMMLGLLMRRVTSGGSSSSCLQATGKFISAARISGILEKESAILDVHSMVSRPMVAGGKIVPRLMMYLALTYDHRLIDRREAVFFLQRIKDVFEDPQRLLLDI